MIATLLLSGMAFLIGTLYANPFVGTFAAAGTFSIVATLLILVEQYRIARVFKQSGKSNRGTKP